jgi:hypothetical protein
MERWEDPASWVQQAGWYVHHGGGFVLYDSPPGAGNYVFTIKLHHSHNIFSPSSKPRWVVGYMDPKNYVEMQLDNKSLSRTEYIDGNKHEFPKLPHKIPDDSPFVTLSVEIQANSLVQRYSLHGTDWQILDNWDQGTSPSLYHGKPRIFTEGKFGFVVPEDRDIEVSNFAFYPKR